MIGESLGTFKISGKLGEGGMGQVFRAQDSKLGREVAIKVLPEAVVQDPERLARFEREAKVLASLNHPNIGAIYGLEEVDGKPFLILELVEGSTLQERISQGPLPIMEALSFARQIATALEAAHAQGIIHRDLKPANVKIDPKGSVKVLDFGLAKAWEPQSVSGSGALLTASPTMTQQMTEAGVLLGTAAYMSPEQARGKEVDKRSDIWAFGAVLLEMLTGRQSFGGETVTDVIAAIVARDPDWNALPADTPQGIKRLLRRCLEKETDNRLHDIADARIEVEEIEEAIASGTLPVSEVGDAPRGGREKIWMAATGALALLALALGWMLASRSEPLEPVVRAQMNPPEGMRYHVASNSPGIATVAPDGRSFAFAAANDDGDFNLWVRQLDQLEAQPIQNTDGARYSFWSAEGRHIAFFGEDKLHKVEAAGGPVLTLADAPNGKGGSWSSEDIVIFAPSHNTPIHRVPAAGGESTAVTTFAEGENSHRHPRFLPDGNRFIFLARLDTAHAGDENTYRIKLGALDGSVDRVLMTSTYQVEIAGGYIWFVIQDTLMAHRFDSDKAELVGDAFPVTENVMSHSGAAFAFFSVSDGGVLAYHAGTAATITTRLVWRDRQGNEISALGEDEFAFDVQLSPDGKSVAVSIEDNQTGGQDIWIYEVERGIKSRFTFSPGSDNTPEWSPDSSRIAFAGEQAGVRSIYLKTVDGAEDAQLFYQSDDGDMIPDAWSPDGRQIIANLNTGTGDVDLWLIPVDSPADAQPLIATEFVEGYADVSPDGRWLAYASNESGEFEIYVTTYPQPGRKWQVSTAGGGLPAWNAAGDRIIYSNLDGMLHEVEVDGSSDTFRVGRIQELFLSERVQTLSENVAITADGERFLINTLASGARLSGPPATLVINFPTELANR